MRRYGKWGGNPEGYPEDITLCVVEVSDAHGWHWYQCNRKRGHGKDSLQDLLCKQHAKMREQGRSLYIPEDDTPEEIEDV